MLDWFFSSLDDMTMSHPHRDANNKYTRKRKNKASDYGEALSKQIEALNAKKRSVTHGFIEPEDKDEYLARIEARKLPIQEKIDRVERINDKDAPEEPATAERLRISDNAEAQDNDSFQQREAKQRLLRVRDNTRRAVRKNYGQLSANVRFKASQREYDMEKDHDLDLERAINKINWGLQEKTWGLDNPDYTDKNAASTIQYVHSQGDYELLNSVAAENDISIQRRNQPGLINKVNHAIKNTDAASPKTILTGQPTIQQEICRGEQTMKDQTPPDEDTVALRQQHYKHNVLDEDERLRYEAQGQWLPRQAMRQSTSRQLAEAYKKSTKNILSS